MLNVDVAWELSLQGRYNPSPAHPSGRVARSGGSDALKSGTGEAAAEPVHECSELYISTKTKIS